MSVSGLKETESFDAILSDTEDYMLDLAVKRCGIDLDELTSIEVSRMRGHLRRALYCLNLCPPGCKGVMGRMKG